MHRFYYPFQVDKQETIIIKEKEILNQIINVLRLKVKDSIILFNSEINKDYIYKISKIDKKDVILILSEAIDKDSELNFELNIFQALPNKMSKIEYIIQKWTEVWITKFVFFRSERSQKISIFWNKLDRLNKIIVEAVEQSWRNKIPELIMEESSLINIVNKKVDCSEIKNLYFHTENKKSLNLKNIDILNNKEFNIFIWPEWWFSDKEIEIFKKANFSSVYLWNRILRTETVSSVVWFMIWQIN